MTRFLGILKGLLVVLALTSAPVLAAPLPPTVQAGDGQASFSLPPGARLESTADPRELLLRFPTPQAVEGFTGLEKALPDWLEAVGSGYDSVLLRFRRPVDGTLTGVNLTVALQPPPKPDPKLADEGQRRLDLVRAQLDLAEERPVAARDRFQTLLARAPDDAEAARGLAESFRFLGHGLDALGILDDLQNRRPDDGGLRAARWRLARDMAAYATVEADGVVTKGNERQWQLRARAHAPLPNRSRLEASAEARRLEDDLVRRADGRITRVSRWVQAAEARFGHSFADGDDLAVGLAWGERPGAVGSFATRILGGLSRVTLEWRRPERAFVEAIDQRADRNRVELRHERRLGRVFAAAGLRASQYQSKQAGNAAGTTGFDLSLRYDLKPRGADWYGLSVGYTVDAEYVGGVKERLDGFDNPFAPLPLTTREVHSLDLTLSGSLGEVLPGSIAMDTVGAGREVEAERWGNLRFDLTAGYGIDRFGGSGPSIGGQLSVERGRHIDLGLRASYSGFTTRGEGSAATRFGGFLTIRI